MDENWEGFYALLLQINCNNYSAVEGVAFFKILFYFQMLAALEISQLLMPTGPTIKDYH